MIDIKTMLTELDYNVAKAHHDLTSEEAKTASNRLIQLIDEWLTQLELSEDTPDEDMMCQVVISEYNIMCIGIAYTREMTGIIATPTVDEAKKSFKTKSSREAGINEYRKGVGIDKRNEEIFARYTEIKQRRPALTDEAIYGFIVKSGEFKSLRSSSENKRTPLSAKIIKSVILRMKRESE